MRCKAASGKGQGMQGKEGTTLKMTANPHDGVGIWESTHTTIQLHAITWEQLGKAMPHLRNLLGEKVQVTVESSWQGDKWDVTIAVLPDFVDRVVRVLEHAECIPEKLPQ